MTKQSLTRAQAAKIFALLMQLPVAKETQSDYTDVLTSSWYCGFVQSVTDNGLMEGTGNQRFLPENTISRQDFAVVLSRIFDLKANNDQELPSDFETVSEYARDAVAAVYQAELIIGVEGRFDPQESVSREMVAVIIERIYQGMLI